MGEKVIEVLNIGVDIAKNIHFASFLADRKGIKNLECEKLGFNNSLKGLEMFLDAIKRYKQNGEDVLIGLEGTGHYWMPLYHHLNAKGLKVVLLNPFDVKQYRKIHKRGTKTDPIDATLIARLMTEKQLYPVNYQQIDFRLRSLSRAYMTVSKEVRRYKNRIHRCCDIIFPEFLPMFGSIAGNRPKVTKTAVVLLKHYPTPNKLLKVSKSALTEIVRKASRGRKKEDFVEALMKKARDSFGISENTEGYEFELEHCIEQIENLKKKMKQFEILISQYSNENLKRLETIPGFGRVIATGLAAELGNIKRFANKKKLTRYVGLNPTVVQSGKFEGKINRISKTGNSHIRNFLYMAAEHAIRCYKGIQIYAERKHNEGKRKKWIKCAIANKLLHRAYAILSENRDYVLK
ncbi:MAG: IS110 family transposase [Candidatus Aenigmarchaeota archaeon]|nr:IS110 family transposase [Candidatus Aenigmarchaeota archaeon]